MSGTSTPSTMSNLGSIASSVGSSVGGYFSKIGTDAAIAAFPFLASTPSFMKSQQTSSDYKKASDEVSNQSGFKMLEDSLDDIHQSLNMNNKILQSIDENTKELLKVLGGKGSSVGSGNGTNGNTNSVISNVLEGAAALETGVLLKQLLGRLITNPYIALGVAATGIGVATYQGIKVQDGQRKNEDLTNDQLIKLYGKDKVNTIQKNAIAGTMPSFNPEGNVLGDLPTPSGTPVDDFRVNMEKYYKDKASKIDIDINNKNQDLAHTKDMESRANIPEKKAKLAAKEVELQDEINKLLEDQKRLLEERAADLEKLNKSGLSDSSPHYNPSSGSSIGSSAPSNSFQRGNFGGAKPNLDDGTNQLIRRLNGNSGSDQNASSELSATDYLHSKGIDPSKVPAGVRNNNPFNLKYYGIGWVGEKGPSKNLDEGVPQSVFGSPDDGMRAGMLNLVNQYKKGANTIEKLAAIYSPSNVDGAIKNFSQFSGFDPKEDLKLTDRDRLIKLAKAVQRQEQGSNSYYDDDMYSKGADRALGLGKYASAASSNVPEMKSAKDVVEHLAEAKRQGLITNDQCVSLTAASVGIKLGNSHQGRDAYASNWVGMGKIDKDTATGTPLITTTRDGRYAGGTGGVAGIGRDHGVNLIHADYDEKGALKGMRVAEQYAGHGFNPNNPERNVRYIYATGKGGENDALSYQMAGVDNGKGGAHLLGQENNPEYIRRNNLLKQKQTTSKPEEYDKNLHVLSSTYNNPVDNARMTKDMFMHQGEDNTNLKNYLISKGIMPEKKEDPLDTLLKQYKAHDDAMYKNMMGRNSGTGEFVDYTKQDLYANMKGRTSPPSVNINNKENNTPNHLTHHKKHDIKPHSPTNKRLHELFVVKAPNGGFSGGIGHM